MKRLLKIGIVAVSLLLVSGPAWATFDIHGILFFDSYYYHQDAQGFARPLPAGSYASLKTSPGSGGIAGVPEGYHPAAKDRNQTYFDLNHATSLRFHWTNDRGLGAVTVIYMNGDPIQQDAGDAGFHVGTAIAYLYYSPFKNLRIAAGKGGLTEVFSPFNPSTYMGYDGVAKVEGLGYGNINSKYENNIRLTYTLNDMVSLDFALVDPRMVSDTDPFPTNPATGELLPGIAVAGTSPDNVTKIPKIEFGVPLKFRGHGISAHVTPSFFWMKSEFDNIAQGDDTITSYGASIGTSIEIGNLKFQGEFNYGQNLWDASRAGLATCYPFKFEYIVGGLRSIMGAKYSTIDHEMHDSKTEAFWLQLGYKIGRVTPTLYYGRNHSWRDMPSGAPGQGDSEFTTQFYGINAPIVITGTLQIVPEFMVYDDGDDNKIVPSYSTTPGRYDFGKEWLAGLEFRLFF